MTEQQYAGLVFVLILGFGGYFAGPPLLSTGTSVLIVVGVAVLLLVLFAWSALDTYLFKRRLDRGTKRYWDRKSKGLCMAPDFGMPDCNNKGVTYVSPACEEFCPSCAEKYRAMTSSWE